MKTSEKNESPLFSWLRTRDGLLTERLELVSGKFGLGRIPGTLAPDTTMDLVCGFCSTGCSLKVHLREGKAVNLTPTLEYPVNLGMACPKGWEALEPLRAPDRAVVPLLRDAERRLNPVSWERAMQTFTARFKDILAAHGPSSVAWLGTGQICTEELAFLGSFAKFGMGLLHGDGNTRQCMATAAVAYKQSFGFDAPPFTYRDFEESDVIVLIGSNLAIAHPILWQRVLRNRRRAEVIVVDPRRTETAMGATRHYAVKPKSDLVFLYGIANLLIQQGWIDDQYVTEHTEGFDLFREHVREFTPDYVANATGLAISEVFHFANSIRSGRRVSFWWTMGVNQGHEAVRTAQAIINLALMTGNIGGPGTGANSITGQCNAMGSRLFSNTTNLLGGRDFKNSEDRKAVADCLSIPVDRIPHEDSLAYDQIITGIRRGQIKGLWMIATNSAHSWIHQQEFADAAQKLEFLVVQDMYHNTETATFADLILPAAGWGEKEGTFINSERRIGLVKKVSSAPGLALSDFNIFRLAAESWGCGEMFKEWSTPESVFQILKRVSRRQPCDFTGIRDYAFLDEVGGVQWPFSDDDAKKLGMSPYENQPASTHLLKAGMKMELPSVNGESGRESVSLGASPSFWEGQQERRLFEDGRFFTPNKRARFIFESPTGPVERTDTEFPFVLITGRGTSAQWHTQSRTAKSDVLRQLYPGGIYVELNPLDARTLGVSGLNRVRVTSRRGSLIARVAVTSSVQAGHLFIPMHYPETNRLTLAVFDPYSRQPSYKHCAVKVTPIDD